MSIIVVNLVLSGDNAIVIGMAPRNLGDKNRKRAIFWGGGIAVVLRIVFTIIAALPLDVPLIHAFGGLLLVAISWQLITPSSKGSDSSISAADSLRGAVRTIMIADIVMSLDNILAVGGAAKGHLGLLVLGLAFSIPLVLVGGSCALHRGIAGFGEDGHHDGPVAGAVG